jgi:hypothetical protein
LFFSGLPHQRPFVGDLASLLLGYKSARTRSSQDADLVTGGGASSPADDPAACLPPVEASNGQRRTHSDWRRVERSAHMNCSA